MKVLYKIPLCLFLYVLLSSVVFAKKKQDGDGIRTEILDVEKRGDKALNKGNYDSATELYEQVSESFQGAGEKNEWLRMELKLAKVYSMLQNYENAAKHYKLVLDTDKLKFEVDDLCSYVDALLILGRNYEAELAARQFYSFDSFRNSRRYNNTLNSLSSLRKYGTDGGNFNVTRHSASSENAEYWVYDLDGQPFYAVSDSPVTDSRKFAFRKTLFSWLGGASSKAKKSLKDIPPKIQNGPSTNYEDYWIVTVIEKQGRVRGEGNERFKTRLYYTVRDESRGKWTKPQPIFDYTDNEANYAHPALFNEGKSLIFSSNMNGGHGGMDLYISQLDEETGTWSNPINLGPHVNTDGDEIFPSVTDDNVLHFSSNGLQGYGGYNIYQARLSGNKVEPGSTYQYPASVNTHYNDLATYFKDGTLRYLTSDRRGSPYREDIYSVNDKDADSMTMSQDGVALNGNLSLVSDLSTNNTTVRENVVPRLVKAAEAEEGEIIARVYFYFDSSELTSESIAVLQSLLNDPELSTIGELMAVGYADEIGFDSYNMRLSQRRAREVSGYLLDNGNELDVLWKGKGRTKPDQDDYNQQLEELKNQAKQENAQLVLSFSDRIKLNRTARRVDIIVRKEK